MISDDLSALDEESLRRVRFAFGLSEEVRAVRRTYAAPDLLERRMPELQLALGPEDAWLGVYNFGERPAPKAVDLASLVPWARYTVLDCDRGQPAAVRGRRLDAGVIEPHGARLFHLRAERPEARAGREPRPSAPAPLNAPSSPDGPAPSPA